MAAPCELGSDAVAGVTAADFLAVVGFVYAAVLTVAAFLFLETPRADILPEIDPVYRFVAALTPRQRLGISLLAVCTAGLIVYQALALVAPP